MANRFFESQPTAGFQKTDFGVSSAAGAGNTKIGFIMRIAAVINTKLSLKTVYEQDYLMWLEMTSEQLRMGKLENLDIESLLEEIEAMA